MAFCNPAQAPSKLIAQAGFDNLLLKHLLFYLQIARELNLRDLYRQFRPERLKREFGSLFSRQSLSLPAPERSRDTR